MRAFDLGPIWHRRRLPQWREPTFFPWPITPIDGSLGDPDPGHSSRSLRSKKDGPCHPPLRSGPPGAEGYFAAARSWPRRPHGAAEKPQEDTDHEPANFNSDRPGHDLSAIRRICSRSLHRGLRPRPVRRCPRRNSLLALHQCSSRFSRRDARTMGLLTPTAKASVENRPAP